MELGTPVSTCIEVAPEVRIPNRKLAIIIPTGFNPVSYTHLVSQAIKLIIDHPQKMYQLWEIAKLVNVSESYFGQLFKKETGMHYICYVHQYKINLAKQYLSKSYLVYEVYEQLGFKNGNYFAKIFKRYVGISPTEYRNRIKSIPQ